MKTEKGFGSDLRPCGELIVGAAVSVGVEWWEVDGRDSAGYAKRAMIFWGHENCFDTRHLRFRSFLVFCACCCCPLDLTILSSRGANSHPSGRSSSPFVEQLRVDKGVISCALLAAAFSFPIASTSCCL